MKRATVILLLIIQIALLFIFHNVYSLLREYQTGKPADAERWLGITNRLGHIFFALTLITAILLLGTGVYLVFRYRRPRGETAEPGEIPHLHNYLMQLKTSENRLKDLVESQQEKVAEKEELNKRIVNTIDAAILLLNVKGRIEIFNRPAETMFGQSLANALNNTPDVVLRAFPELGDFIVRHASAKSPASEEIRSADRVFLVNAAPLDSNALLVIVRDITEEKKRDEIDRRNGNFIMLGEMTAFLAHEVRNSLGVIYGYTRTIKGDEAKMEKINREIEFLTGMMERFLQFAKPVRAEKMELVRLDQLIREIAGERGLAAECSGENSAVWSDPALLAPVFSNLLLNAREAGADRVSVVFSRERDLIVDIADNGRGVDAKNSDKIWLPFFTTRDKGAGMGLPGVRKLVNALGGEISLLASKPGETIFRVRFFNPEIQ